jgi:hypothetical protein
MKRKTLLYAFGTVLAAALAAAAPAFARPPGTALADADCGKCHPSPASDLTLAGEAHLDVNCSGCHLGHPPRSPAGIPLCAQCHNGERHYEKESCAGCHSNPHMPLRIVMSNDGGNVCRDGHAAAFALIANGGSLHSEQSCPDCHDAHRHKPACVDCHEGHDSGSISSKCGTCHQPHMPQPVIFAGSVPNSACAGCHPDTYNMLRTNDTGHRRRTCISCHQKTHGSPPTCASCHGLPHRLSADALFQDCRRCHRGAHNLTVWPVGETAQQK